MRGGSAADSWPHERGRNGAKQSPRDLQAYQTADGEVRARGLRSLPDQGEGSVEGIIECSHSETAVGRVKKDRNEQQTEETEKYMR